MFNEAYVTKQFYGAGTETAEPLCLSLFIGPGFFQYAISTQQFKLIKELAHVQISETNTSPLQDSVVFLIQNHLLNRKKFEKVNIALLGTDFAMIPNAYAQQESLKPLLAFSTGEVATKPMLHQALHDVTFCFAPDAGLLTQLERSFPNASLRHSGVVSIHLLFSHHSLKSCDIFLNIHDGFIELAAKRKSGLLFYNVFNYSTGEDILYYLLFMMEQFDLDPAFTKLGVAGQQPVTDGLMEQLKKYIHQLVFCTPDPSVRLEGELQQLPAHYYFTLLNQHLCEL